jgi:hypothetical protein
MTLGANERCGYYSLEAACRSTLLKIANSEPAFDDSLEELQIRNDLQVVLAPTARLRETLSVWPTRLQTLRNLNLLMTSTDESGKEISPYASFIHALRTDNGSTGGRSTGQESLMALALIVNGVLADPARASSMSIIAFSGRSAISGSFIGRNNIYTIRLRAYSNLKLFSSAG